MKIIYCCFHCRTRYEVGLMNLREIPVNLRCPSCGLAEVNPEETPLAGYTIRDGELVKK